MHSGFWVLVWAPVFSILVIRCSGIPVLHGSIFQYKPNIRPNIRIHEISIHFSEINVSKRVKSFQPFKCAEVAIEHKVFITSVYVHTVDGQRFASCILKWLAVSATWIVERISLQKVPPAKVCVWNTFGNISCNTDTVLGKIWKMKQRFQVPRAKEQEIICNANSSWAPGPPVSFSRRGLGTRKRKPSWPRKFVLCPSNPPVLHAALKLAGSEDFSNQLINSTLVSFLEISTCWSLTNSRFTASTEGVWWIVHPMGDTRWQVRVLAGIFFFSFSRRKKTLPVKTWYQLF